MRDTIATVLKFNVDKLVEASPFFSLLIDKSTDVINHENLVVHVKLLNEFKSKLHFLENINFRNGKAETITNAVNLLMERRKLHKDKMKGFGSDGASVMTGKNNGVSKQRRTIVHFSCLSTAWLTGLRFAQAKRLMIFLIWQNSKRSLLLCRV